MDGPQGGLDDFRRQFGRLIEQLLHDAGRTAGEPLQELITAHLGPAAATLPIVRDVHPAYDLPNAQLAVDALLARPDVTARALGIGGQGRRFGGLGLSDLLTSDGWTVGPPEFTNAEIGPDGETLACMTFTVLLLDGPRGPVALLMQLGEGHGMGGAQLVLEAASPAEGAADATLAELRGLMLERDVFRGKVITLETEPMTERSRVRFVRRPALGADDLVLPPGVLERIERHVLGPTRHRAALQAAGRHLARGLLLWGPPGTGKTLTVRYLTARLTEATVIILAGPALGLAGAFGGLARRLAPAVVVLEDVDLVAEERSFGPGDGGSPVLFDLMNEMSGHGEDADIAFVLTTNRPDALEPALAARPGRVDLAVEIPLPDDEARRRLLRRYARGIDLEPGDDDALVARTEGVTASFIRELLRRAVLAAAEDGRVQVRRRDLDDTLDDLLHERARLTRVLLGAEAPAADDPDDPHAWLAAFPEPPPPPVR